MLLYKAGWTALTRIALAVLLDLVGPVACMLALPATCSAIQLSAGFMPRQETDRQAGESRILGDCEQEGRAKEKAIARSTTTAAARPCLRVCIVAVGMSWQHVIPVQPSADSSSL